jgi:hypothetical protein
LVFVLASSVRVPLARLLHWLVKALEWDSEGQVLRVLTCPDDQRPLAFNAGASKFAVAESDPAPGAPDAVRAFDTCAECSDARGRLRLAAPHVTTQLTVLEKTVVDDS